MVSRLEGADSNAHLVLGPLGVLELPADLSCINPTVGTGIAPVGWRVQRAHLPLNSPTVVVAASPRLLLLVVNWGESSSSLLVDFQWLVSSFSSSFCPLSGRCSQTVKTDILLTSLIPAPRSASFQISSQSHVSALFSGGFPFNLV